MTRSRRVLALSAIVLAAVTGLSACGEDTLAPEAKPDFVGTAASGPHNDADVKFSQALFPYFAQSMELSELALAKSKNSTITEVANGIKQDHAKNVAVMGGWLSGWEEKAPMGDPAAMKDATGPIVTKTQLDRLKSAEGAAFDKLWVDTMIKRGEAVIKVANTQAKSGQNEEAKKFAADLAAEQTDAVAKLKKAL